VTSKARTYAIETAEGEITLNSLARKFQEAIDYGRRLERRAAKRRLERVYQETECFDHGGLTSREIYEILESEVLKRPQTKGLS